jgi:hypothetical protein
MRAQFLKLFRYFFENFLVTLPFETTGGSGGGSGQGDHDAQAVQQLQERLQGVQGQAADLLSGRKETENLGISGKKVVS